MLAKMSRHNPMTPVKFSPVDVLDRSSQIQNWYSLTEYKHNKKEGNHFTPITDKGSTKWKKLPTFTHDQALELWVARGTVPPSG